MLAFHERHRAPGYLIVLGLTVAVGCAAALALSVPSLPQRESSDAGVLVAALAVGISIGLGAATQHMSIIVRDETLTVYLTPFYRRRIRIDEIRAVTSDTIDVAAYAGIGVRRAPGRPPAVFQRGGPAARLDMTDSSTLMIECDDVDALRRSVFGTASAP